LAAVAVPQFIRWPQQARISADIKAASSYMSVVQAAIAEGIEVADAIEEYYGGAGVPMTTALGSNNVAMSHTGGTAGNPIKIMAGAVEILPNGQDPYDK